MADVIKFPNGGYEVTIVRKQDIIDTIDSNILDKEVALAVVEQCEMTSTKFIREGRWTGIPFIGNIRIPKTKQLLRTEEQQALLKEAHDNLDTQDYVLFKKKLNEENKEHIKMDRYYRYIVSSAISKRRDLFKKLANEKGECFARIYIFSLSCIKAIENEFEILNYDK